MCVCFLERLIKKTKKRMKKTTITTSDIVGFFMTHRTSKKVKRTFWRWMTHPCNEEEKEEALCHVWNQTLADLDKSVFKSLWQVKKKAGWATPSTFSMPQRNWLRIAASFVIPLLSVIGAWWYVAHYNCSSEMIECRTALGEQKELLLPDGTKVRLNAESFLLYPRSFYSDKRVVYLSGEGYFDVEKDPKHPFVVRTAQVAVRVLGTRFNVKAYADLGQTITVLESGSVEVKDVQRPSNRNVLKPGEQLVLNHYNRVLTKTPVNLLLVNGWIRGELNFVNSSLNEIISAVERHFNVKISTDRFLELGTDRYTLKFKAGESFEKVMAIIELTVGGMEVKFLNKESVVLMPTEKKKKKGGAT